jgi:uncharacterized protein (DUF4415 family)
MAKSGTKSSDMSKGGKSRSLVRSAARSAGSSRHGIPADPSDENITIVSRDSPSQGKTDWAAFDALTEEQIEEAIRNDPDWSDDWKWSDAVLVIPPKKKAISIRVDEDVLDYFKGEETAGYQRRINAVLRSFVHQKTAAKKKRAK